MKKLKIGIITHNFPTSVKDRQNAGIFVYDFAKVLNTKANVRVLSPGIQDGVGRIGNIKVYFFKFDGKLGSLKIYNPLHILKFWNFFTKGRKALKDFLNDNLDLDFIISMWAFPSGHFAYQAFKDKKIPYAVYCLGSDIYIYAKKPILRNLIKQYLKSSKLLFADSPDLSNMVEKISGNKTLFIPSSSNFSVKSKKKPKDKNKITLTFLGRLELIKGIDILMSALECLNDELDSFKVNIIGSGSLEVLIKEKITKSNFKEHIKFWGNISDSEKISEILNQSDWTIIPSRSDSIPLVFSESMKASSPVIVSDLPDLKYLVDKYKVGISFRRDSVEDLTKVLRSVSKINNMSFKKNTIRVAEIFDLEKSSAKILKLIDGLVLKNNKTQ